MLSDLILREPVVRVDNDSKIFHLIFVTPKLEFQQGILATMQLITGISINTQTKSYMLSLTVCVVIGEEESDDNKKSALGSCCSGLIGIFLFSWFICGKQQACNSRTFTLDQMQFTLEDIFAAIQCRVPTCLTVVVVKTVNVEEQQCVERKLKLLLI